MNYETQQTQVMEALRNRELDEIFNVSEEKPESVLFQGNQTLGDGDCIISLSLNGGNFAPIYYCIERLDDIKKKDELLNLFNEFNEENLVLNFFLHKEDTIMCRITYISSIDNFNAKDYVSLVEIGFKSIKDKYYEKIMDILSK